ncbi:MAG: hypothetical protein ACTSU5_20280 [Promethearchaeota archaeon]
MNAPNISRGKYLKVVWPTCVGLALAFLAVARLLWPASSPQYCDAWETISGLGNAGDNPVGFLFFQLAMVAVGVLVVPTFLYLHPRLSRHHRVAALLGTFWMVVGAAGMLLTGFIPDGTVPIDKFHEITAGAGFGGILFASFFYWFATRAAGRAGEVTDRRLGWAATALWVAGIVATGAAYAVAEFVVKPAYDLGWYGCEWGAAGISAVISFAVWERVMFAVAVAYLAIVVALVPDEGASQTPSNAPRSGTP